MKKVLLIFFITAFFANTALAQREFNNWCFGNNIGLTFNGMKPEAMTSKMYSLEGCSSVSDRYGNLYFYTNGQEIYNKNHQIMKNGDSLNGNYSCSQAALIVPRPGNNLEYYVFALDEVSQELHTKGLSYSVVDMNKENELGEVITKNVALWGQTMEMMTAVRHSNETDIWIITHEMYNNSFRAYLLTHDGIMDSVISKTGTNHSMVIADHAVGCMKAAPHGNRLALAHNLFFEVFDFNNTTGVVSNPITLLPPDIIQAYGVEFSPDGTKLYTSNYVKDGKISKLFQFDLFAGSLADIQRSAVLIAVERANYMFGALQAGPDKKIYIAKHRRDSLSVIEKPNEKGISCNFIDNYLHLNGTCQLGLPAYIQTSVTTIDIAATTPVCEEDSVVLTCSSIDAHKFHWTGPKGFVSDEQNPVLYNVSADQSGTYKVVLTYKDGYLDSSSVDVYIKETIFDNLNELQFEPLHIGGFKEMEITYKNSSAFELYIDTVYLKKKSGPAFQLIDMPDFPYEMQAGESVNFKVLYHPTEVVDYLDSLIVKVFTPCERIDTVEVVGQGLSIDLYLWLPDTSAAIGQHNFCMPLKATLACDDTLSIHSDYSVKVHFDWTAFLPYADDPNMEVERIADEIVLSIKADDFKFTGDTITLKNICGTVYFGYYDKTPILISDFEWPDTLVTFENNRIHIKDGSLSINNLCQSPISRVQSFQRSSVELSPNPVADFVNIEADCQEAGAYEIKIYNLSGIELKSFDWFIKREGDYKQQRDINLDVSGYSSGLYQLTMKTPSEIITKRLFIVK